MPKLAHPLTDTQVKRAKAGAKSVKLYDGNGLYLEVLPIGSKFWRFRVTANKMARKVRSRLARIRNWAWRTQGTSAQRHVGCFWRVPILFSGVSKSNG